MNIIDPHIHLFNLTEGNYFWLHKLKNSHSAFLGENTAVIYQSFTEQDLTLNTSLKPALNLAGFVHIEAGFDNEKPWREIAWLENTCQYPFRTIAFIDITKDEKSFQTDLAKLLSYSSVIGVRYIFDEQALLLLNHSKVLQNLAWLNQQALTTQALIEKRLIFEVQMPIENTQAVNKLIEVMNTLPHLTWVINHAGCPNINNDISNQLQSQATRLLWQENLKKLAVVNQVAIKYSGFEMFKQGYTSSDIQTVLNDILKHFSSDKIMFASNFPLCLSQKNYPNYWQMLTQELALTPKQLTQFCFANAARIYQLNLDS